MNAKVSILIHNLNRAPILERCLESVAQVAYRPLEVLVLDAGSNDGSQQIIERALTQMRAVGIEGKFVPCDPMGCPASRNLAAAHATGDLLFFMDNDATLTSDSDLGVIATMFAERPSLAIVSFRILLEDSPTIDPFAWVFRRPREQWRDRAFTTFTFAGAGYDHVA